MISNSILVIEFIKMYLIFIFVISFEMCFLCFLYFPLFSPHIIPTFFLYSSIFNIFFLSPIFSLFYISLFFIWIFPIFYMISFLLYFPHIKISLFFLLQFFSSIPSRFSPHFLDFSLFFYIFPLAYTIFTYYFPQFPQCFLPMYTLTCWTA